MNTIDLPVDRMNGLGEVLQSFDPITLEEMDHVKLLDRVDTKFTFGVEKLPLLLEEMVNDYRILEVNGIRMCGYETRYFDTDDFRLYMHHHNGKLNRYKLRFRKYVDSGTTFFEIKLKNSKGRMIKKRVEVSDIEDVIRGTAEELLVRKTRMSPEIFHPALNVYYSRITLVNKNSSERLTVDTGLNYDHGKEKLAFPLLVIVESKQDRSANSPFISLMRKHHIRELSISKYCLGVAYLVNRVKKNNFKFKIIQLNKSNHGTE